MDPVRRRRGATSARMGRREGRAPRRAKQSASAHLRGLLPGLSAAAAARSLLPRGGGKTVAGSICRPCPR
eukprot:12902824-Alexandrium_andersonii.AAC.1